MSQHQQNASVRPYTSHLYIKIQSKRVGAAHIQKWNGFKCYM